jgi:hypothetical protein
VYSVCLYSRDSSFYLQQVERSKAIKNMEEKKLKRNQNTDNNERPVKILRTFHQRKLYELRI